MGNLERSRTQREWPVPWPVPQQVGPGSQKDVQPSVESLGSRLCLWLCALLRLAPPLEPLSPPLTGHSMSLQSTRYRDWRVSLSNSESVDRGKRMPSDMPASRLILHIHELEAELGAS